MFSGYWVLECWEFGTAGTMFFEPKLLFSVSDMYMNGCYCAMASCTGPFMLRIHDTKIKLGSGLH